MGSHQKIEPSDSVAEILGRAFNADETKLPRATAELILKAELPESDKDRVDELLERKRDSGLSEEQEALLRDYLHVDSLLTILKSRARRVLAESAAA
jgi:hypothetical protein